MSQASPESLIYELTDARARTCALIDHLNDEQMMGPRLATVNPLRWEIGHAAYFYEYWILRKHYGAQALIPSIDELFDSIHIPHETRWDLKLPSLQDTINYMQEVKDRVVMHLSNGEDDEVRDYLTQYAIFHEDMHCEAFTYTRQTLSYPMPKVITYTSADTDDDRISGDAHIPGGKFKIGAFKDDGFVFDNEKWAHDVEIKPFQISKLTVSNHEFAQFVEEGGYQQEKLWCKEGWQWRAENNLQHPVYWRKSHSDHAKWEVRWFDQWQPLAQHAAVINVSWYEANAYCRWVGRRLPTEYEWEVAAAGVPSATKEKMSDQKRKFPWGNNDSNSQHANLNGESLGSIDVNAKPEGDSAFGCRQMIGNVWEWTSSVFAPYPEFTPDMYEDYSQPLFGKTKVLRGGCWATRSRLIRNTWRNYYHPSRNDVFSGFRTCAVNDLK